MHAQRQLNENYQLHRNEVHEMGATWNSLATDHLVPISNAKTIQMQEDRATDIEKANRVLFERIEGIMFRNGPFKKQISRISNKKSGKVFHVPSDHLITPSTYIP